MKKNCIMIRKEDSDLINRVFLPVGLKGSSQSQMIMNPEVVNPYPSPNDEGIYENPLIRIHIRKSKNYDF
jgi:hypothetical protein